MLQTHHQIWVAMLLQFSVVTPLSADIERPRPNVLFIAVDDLRPALGCYGDQLAKTPNIDRFSTTARQFNRAYVQQAVCGPSRTSILTGLLPDRTRVWHNRNRFREALPNHMTLPQLFKQNGYRTLSYGKIFSGNEKELDPNSWSEPEVLRRKGWKNYLLPHNQGKEKKQAPYEFANVADDAYPDGKLAHLAVETLEKLEKDNQPFFLSVGFFKPHLPFNAPKKYWDLYDPEDFDLPEPVRAPIKLLPKLALHTHAELGGYKVVPKDERLDVQQTRLLRHGYYACVSYIDVQIGKLLDTLRRLQLDQSTIVVLWGDHGFALGETSRWCKGTNFELDTRVPLLIRTPDLGHPGVSTDSLVEMVDLYPTLTSLAGVEPPDGLDGRSFALLLQNPHETGRDVVLSQFNRPWSSSLPEVMGYSIRTTSHRYTRWMKWSNQTLLSEELYDYNRVNNTKQLPPYLIERQNPVNDSVQSTNLQQLRQLMDQVISRRSLMQH